MKKVVTLEKQKSWEEFGKNMEESYKGNQKLFYKVIKSARKGNQRQGETIKNIEGQLLRDKEKIMCRWKEYFEGLLMNSGNSKDGKAETEQEVRREKRVEEVIITWEDTVVAVKLIKNGKAPGHDQIAPEMIKALDSNGILVLHKIFIKVWNEKRVPDDWKIDIIAAL